MVALMQMLQIIYFLPFQRCLVVGRASEDQATQAFEWETATLALGLLTLMVSGAVEVVFMSMI